MESEIEQDFPSFKQFFKNANLAAIVLLNKEGTILASNRGVEVAYGYTRDDLQGKNFSLMFTLEDKLKNRPEIELATVLEKGAMSDINYVVHKDSSYIWSNGETVFTKNESGEIVLVKVLYDINHQKKLETFLMNANVELSNKNEELIKVNNDLDTFVYTASHDLKAPINNIEALINIVHEGLTEECKSNVQESIEMIRHSIEKFQSVISDLGHIGKSNSGTSAGAKEIYFSEVLEDIKITLREQIKEAQAGFLEKFETAAISNYPIHNLRSILHNLVSNAIKYRDPERKPMIDISTKREAEYVLLRVEDNGLGIKENDRHKVFGMYERAHDHVAGTGVGLSIVKRLVSNSGGKIMLESEEGKGSVFKIYLPLQ
jgi:PAS domain S-box-containing protein